MRTLESLLATVGSVPRITVYHRGDATQIDQFPNRNVEVSYRQLPPDGPDSFLVIERDEQFVGAIGLDDVDRLTKPPVPRLGHDTTDVDGYRVFFEVLDDTVFTSMERGTLLAVTREIEDRAYRVGTGSLHVSFQRLSKFTQQVPVYRALASDTDLDIHVYGVADWDAPTIPGVTYHEVDTGELDRYWALAFDGGDHPNQACGLLAQERTSGYTGFWSDDPGMVADIRAGLFG